MEQTELDLRELIGILRRRLWLVLAMPIVAGLTAGIISQFVLDPVYSASTTLWVIKDGQGQINYNDLLLNRNLTKTYAEVAKSRATMADAIDRLHLKGQITVAQLQSKLTVNPVKDTEILSFTIEDGNPALAANLADGVARAFQDQIKTYMKVENVVVVDQATVPTAPIRPRKLMNVAIAFILGLMAALGVTFLLEYMDTTIKSPDDVSRHVGLPVLGLIPHIDPSGMPVTPQRSRSRATSAKTVVEK